MKKYLLTIPALLVVMFFATPVVSFAQTSADAILGEWLNEEKDGKVKIYKVGNEYHGKISWLRDPIDVNTGKAQLDVQNPDESARKKQVLGLIVLKDFEYDDGEWEGGTIYDPKNGKTYKCYMKFEDNGNLKIRGYIGKSWMGLGRSTYWTRG